MVFIPFVFVWLWLTDKGMVVIDPCSATPGHDYTAGLILLALFPPVAGILQYWCIRRSGFPERTGYWISGLLPTVCLVFSFFGMTVLLYAVEPRLSDTHLWSFIYKIGCYNDPEVKSDVLFALTSICHYLLTILFLRILRRRKRPNTME